MTVRQEQRFEKDRLDLLALAQARYQLDCCVPAELLEPVIEMLDYTLVKRRDVAAGVLSYCDFDNHTVIVPHDFACRLDFPESAPGVLKATLAHELGHIRLHARRAVKGIRFERWENEAHLYAMVFLVPRQQLSLRPELEALRAYSSPSWRESQCQRELWALVMRLADHFQVTRSFVTRALVSYGQLSMDRQHRILRPLAC